MLNKVKKTIEKYGLLTQGDGVLIGLSGGADSVCLTHILYRLQDDLGIKLYTAHLNHSLRGERADGDERFALSFSQGLGIECISEKNDVKSYAKKHGVSEEMAGRELRYAFFERVSKNYGLKKIATAHNKNDNAETILMNFMRGGGLSGLCGIPFKRDNIIRPLLEVSREEIEGYCRDNGLDYVTDSTNNETVYTRNKIRLELIPKIQKEFNPAFIQTVTKNALLMSEELDFIGEKTDEAYENVSDGAILIEELNKLHIAIKRRLIIKMMKSAMIKDISAQYVESVIELADKGQSGSSVNLPCGNTARIEYGKLIIGKNDIELAPFEYDIPLNEEIYISELGITVKAEFCEGADVFAGGEASKITVRNKRDGDYFYPVGMDGRKKLKNYFIDEKIPRHERSKTAVLTINDEIAWIIGKRRDRRFEACGRGIKISLK